MIINRLFAPLTKLPIFRAFCTSTPIRLSKYLANTSVCSRRQAEKLIQQGMVLVDGKKVESNVPVTKESRIQVFTKQGERMPIKQSTKVWIFYKPVGLICSHNDPFKRPSFYDFAKAKLKTDQHLISVGRLDFNSEGLIIVTNDGDLARCMELPASKIERQYRVRVYGNFTEDILLKIRQGATIGGIKYGPYWVNVENRQSRNTWLLMRLESGKNREIRRVMRKFSLRVNRIVRTSYGPYKLGGLKPGEFYETEVEPEIKRKMYLYTRKKLEEHTETLRKLEGAKIQPQVERGEKSQKQRIDQRKQKDKNELPLRQDRVEQLGGMENIKQ